MMTVLLATCNGEKTLPLMLEACCRLDEPAGGWKLVIVDNGSTDRTTEIIQGYAGRLPLTYLREPVLGKNAALNTGLAAVAGDVVVLTDDDVIPMQDWLVRMRAAVEAHPDHQIFGGTVLPRWEVPPPSWIISWVPLGPAYTVLNPQDEPGSTNESRIFGPNMAVRTEVFRAGHRFDPAIGPRGSNYPMGSETEFVRRLLAAGCTAWYEPGAVVEHFIRAEQLEREWILSRAYRFGRGAYRKEYSGPPPHAWGGVPRYLFRELITSLWWVARSFAFGDAEERFQAQWKREMTRGKIAEARLMHLAARRSR